MSMHKVLLTIIEEGGLKAHGLDISKPSQLSDAFRQGVAWGLDNSQPKKMTREEGQACFDAAGKIIKLQTKIAEQACDKGLLRIKVAEQAVEIQNWKDRYECNTAIMHSRTKVMNEQATRIKALEEDVEHYKSEAHDASMSRVQIGKLQEHIAKLKTPPVLSQWIRGLELEIRASPMNYVFTFPRDKTLELMGISMEVQAAFHALKTENESLAPIKEALVKAKLALDSCDVNDTQFPLDTQYYDRELVDEAIAVIEKLPK